MLTIRIGLQPTGSRNESPLAPSRRKPRRRSVPGKKTVPFQASEFPSAVNVIPRIICSPIRSLVMGSDSTSRWQSLSFRQRSGPPGLGIMTSVIDISIGSRCSPARERASSRHVRPAQRTRAAVGLHRTVFGPPPCHRRIEQYAFVPS